MWWPKNTYIWVESSRIKTKGITHELYALEIKQLRSPMEDYGGQFLLWE